MTNKIIELSSWDKYYEWVNSKIDPNKVLIIGIKEGFEEEVIAIGY